MAIVPLKEIIKSIWRTNEVLSNGPLLWPVLVGHTGAGKTTIVRELAKEMGLEVKTLLLGTMLPEDVLGLPKILGGKTAWTLPEWVPKGPAIIFLDELDKARPETLATVLTLLAERRVRDHLLPPGVLFVGAMQPVSRHWLASEEAKAIASRSVFLPAPYDWGWLERKHGLHPGALAWLPQPKVTLPRLPNPTPRQVDWALRFLANFRGKEEVIEAVLGGLFAPEVAQALRESAKGEIPAEDIAKELKPEDIWQMPLERVAILLGPLATHGSLEAYCEALVKIWGTGPKELWEKALTEQWEWLKARSRRKLPIGSLYGDTPDLFGDTPEEEVARALQAAAERAIVEAANRGAKVSPEAQEIISQLRAKWKS